MNPTPPPDWLTPARERLFADEYQAGVPRPHIWLHLLRTDPEMPRPPSWMALTNFANNRGLYRPGSKHRHWTDDEVTRLRDLTARRAEREEIIKAFPDFSYRQIDRTLVTLGLRRPVHHARTARMRTEKISHRRNIRLTCLGCRLPFMSWDRRRNRQCATCFEAASGASTDNDCHVELA